MTTSNAQHIHKHPQTNSEKENKLNLSNLKFLDTFATPAARRPRPPGHRIPREARAAKTHRDAREDRFVFVFVANGHLEPQDPHKEVPKEVSY